MSNLLPHGRGACGSVMLLRAERTVTYRYIFHRIRSGRVARECIVVKKQYFKNKRGERK